MVTVDTNQKQQKRNAVRAVARFSMLFVFFFIFFTSVLALIGIFEYAEAESDEKEEEAIEESDAPNEKLVEDRSRENLESSSHQSEEQTRRVENTIEDPRIPTNISAPAIELEKQIVNPRSRDTETLNKALRRGVTYYPRSGYLGQNSNIFLFGHSSWLPVVNNEHYRSFNRLSELEPGDPVYLTSGSTRYTYRVTKSFEARDHEIVVDFKSDKPRLTLTTCNVFGEKEDRFIVEAILAKKEKMR